MSNIKIYLCLNDTILNRIYRDLIVVCNYKPSGRKCNKNCFYIFQFSQQKNCLDWTPKMLRKCYQNEEENHKKNNQTHPEREVEEREWERECGERVRRPQTPCTGYAYKLSCFLWVVRGLELHTHDSDGVANMIMIRIKCTGKKLKTQNC